MANRANNRRNNAQPQPAPAEAVETVDGGGNVVELPVPAGKTVNMFDERSRSIQGLLNAKRAVLTDAETAARKAQELWDKGAGTEAEASTEGGRAAFILYQARLPRTEGNKLVPPLLSEAEVTAHLGKIFGFKAKQDGSPSKTPDGKGEYIRKRVNRAYSAWDFVTNGNADRFFDGLPAEPFRDLVESMNKGETPLFTAYDKLAETKRKLGTTIPLAFDPARIAKLVESLQQPGAREMIHESAALIAVYHALHETLNVIATVSADAIPEAAVA